jgi:RNA polymerase sigma factor (sigma-70 family)
MPPAIAPPRNVLPNVRPWTDGELARAAGRGDVAAFEELYARHHRGLLSFSRHMLGYEHEDVVQHTFLAADTAFRQGQVPRSVRAWLYTVARNRCISTLRARRDDGRLPDRGVASTEDLAADVERREEVRALVADLRRLPDEQRAALLLTELGELSHAEVAQVIGVRTAKVKALVFQARQSLLAAGDARSIPCRSVQEELATATGPARRPLRDHVARCDGCRAYAARLAAQRASLASILPVAPPDALREGVLPGLVGGGATAATGGASAGLGLLTVNSTAAKLLAIAVVGSVAGGGTVAVRGLDLPPRAPSAAQEQGPAAAAASSVPARVAQVRTGRAGTGTPVSRPALAVRHAERTQGARDDATDAAGAPDRSAGTPAPEEQPPAALEPARPGAAPGPGRAERPRDERTANDGSAPPRDERASAGQPDARNADPRPSRPPAPAGHPAAKPAPGKGGPPAATPAPGKSGPPVAKHSPGKGGPPAGKPTPGERSGPPAAEPAPGKDAPVAKPSPGNSDPPGANPMPGKPPPGGSTPGGGATPGRPEPTEPHDGGAGPHGGPPPGGKPHGGPGAA